MPALDVNIPSVRPDDLRQQGWCGLVWGQQCRPGELGRPHLHAQFTLCESPEYRLPRCVGRTQQDEVREAPWANLAALYRQSDNTDHSCARTAARAGGLRAAPAAQRPGESQAHGLTTEPRCHSSPQRRERSRTRGDTWVAFRADMESCSSHSWVVMMGVQVRAGAGPRARGLRDIQTKPKRNLEGPQKA